MIIDDLLYALSKLDWRYVKPSRFDYSAGDPVEVVQTWQERMFAYEIYHQLRLLWTVQPERGTGCVIHAEVRKGYQHIADFDFMPDFIFHLPQPGQNFAVVEVKLAGRSLESIRIDLNKLVRFKTELNYEAIVEILVGSDKDIKRVILEVSSDTGTPVHILGLSTDTRQTGSTVIKYH